MPRPDIMGRKSSDTLEQEHVYSVYDQIAPCFSEISQKAWPNVRRFLKRLQPGSLVADIGCGSGRYLHINKSIFKVGLDICCPLVESARTKGHEVLVADNLKLPFRSGLFDAVISVGVIHHFATTERRIEAIRELARIVRPGGQMMLYVWAYEQKHRRFDGQDVLIPWHEGQRTSKSADKHGLLPSCSDKDLSSVSSVSEDESSADTSDFTLPGRTLQRTASETFKDTLKDSLQELDNVFLSDNTVPKITVLRQRSNTLPNIINTQRGMYPSEKKGRTVFSKSVLAEECRRFEASMKALSVSHNHHWYGGEESQEGLGIDVTGEYLEADVEGSDITEEDENRIPNGSHDTSYKYLTHNSSITGKMQTKHQQYCQSSKSHKSKKVVSKSKLASTETYLSSESVVEPIPAYQSHIHVAKNVKVKSVQDLKHQIKGLNSGVNKQISERSISKPSVTSSKKDIKKEDGEKEEVSFFNLIKAKIKKVFDTEPPPKPLESPDVISKSMAIENWLLHSFGEDGTLGSLSTSTSLDEFEGFAVREFPQSSCPSNRNSVDITDDPDRLNISGQINKTNGVIAVTDDVLGNGLPQNSVNGDLGMSDWKRDVFHNGVNGHLSTDDHNTVTQTSEKLFVSSRSENSVQNCAHNKNRHSNVGSISHIKSHDQSRRSHDFTINNKSCDQYSALGSLCRVTDLDLSGNNSRPDFIGEFCQGEKTSTGKHSKWNSGKTDVSKTGIKSKSLQTLNGYSNGTTESCQPKCLSTGKKHSQELSNECASKQLSRYYHVFKEGELIELITDNVQSLRVVSNMFDHSNWCVVVEKK
ncbi:uncharacterized protein LOC132563605 [Ylistrum balloti]|uniref:uncharacterized protein LOC132563605 n=1 Tax=Ylistrum balloti TaxID=509963 RepID=UPI002905BCFB|nr:uncharacterized protein LOC132563605 [Ylistrum balloti]